MVSNKASAPENNIDPISVIPLLLHQLVSGAGRLVVLYCVLRGPVHRHGPDQAAAAHLEEIYQVPDASMIEGAFDGRGCDFKVLVSPCVHPLVGGDSQSCDLVELTHDEHGDPHEVENAVEEHPEHPRRARGDLSQVEPEAILSVAGGAVDPPVGNAAVYHPADH